MRRIRLSLVAFLAATLALGLAGPASAGPKADDGRFYFELKPAPGSSAQAAVTCAGYATAPSVSGGWVQWELHFVCTAVGDLYARSEVYSIRGTGSNGSRTKEGQMIRTRIGTFVDGYTAEPCLSNTPTRWVANVFAEYNGIHFVPYPAWSPQVTIPCGGTAS